MRRIIITSLSLLTLGFAPLSAQKTESVEGASQQARKVSATKQYPVREVKGRVVDATTRQPLGGVLVSVAELEGYSTLTESDGTYTLRVPLIASSLSYSSPGYNLLRVGLLKGE